MYTSYLLRACIIPAMVICGLSSCEAPGSLTSDIAPLDRQKENFFYVPSTPNTRFSNEKNDFTFDVQRTSGSRYNGVNVQASYLPSEHLGIIGGYSSAKNKGGGLPDFMTYRHFEIGAGYISKFSTGWHFENYIGAGRGNLKNFHYSGTSTVKSTRVFVQPAIAYTSSKNTISVGLASRISGVNFSLSQMQFDTSREPHTWDQLNAIIGQPFHIIWEPGLIMNAGWKNFKFNAGYTVAKDLTSSHFEIPSSNLTLGVSIQLNAGKKGQP